MPCVCTKVKMVSRTLGRTYDATLKEAGISNTQFAVLREIARRDGVPLAHLAESLEMDRTSLYRAINPMIRDGWVQVAGGEDARSRTAELTHQGSRLLDTAGLAWRRLQEHVIEKFGRKSYRSLIEELERLAECASSFEP
jgi:DNA-binding MarR family transcriptional regulator